MLAADQNDGLGTAVGFAEFQNWKNVVGNRIAYSFDLALSE